VSAYRYPVWLQAGVCVVAALCLISGIRTYRDADAYAHAFQDPYMINAQATRWSEALRTLPPNIVTGYLSDLPLDGTPGQAAFFGVANALAPRLVVRDADGPQWVVGNFSRPMDFAAAGSAHGLQMVRDFGNGAVVFRRRAQ
jgi:hypothetical protein